MTFDPTKPVQTRDGQPARIICTDVVGEYPIVAVITNDSGSQWVNLYGVNGNSVIGDSSDLINVPKKIVRYLNVYDEDDLRAHKTRQGADMESSSSRIACIRIEFEEGQLDD